MSCGPNAHLVGRAALAGLATPALLLDRAPFERNLARMAEAARRSGRALRPHVKAHKSTRIARRQLEAGAVGLCCATLREIDVMAAAGLPGLLLTTPPVGEASIERLRQAQAVSPDLAVVVDSEAGLAALAEAFTPERPLGVLVDVDVGQGRTGAVGPEQVVRLAQAAAGSPSLRYRGIQAYYGHLQHVQGYAERRSRAAEQWARLTQVVDALRAAGLAPEIVTGGGTGTHHLDLAEGPFTEVQPGSYLFMDKQYGAVEIAPEEAQPFAVALTVAARVVSVNQPGLAVIDAGLKAMATDAGAPLVAAGAPEGATYQFMGDEHGGIRVAAPASPPALGAVVRLTAPHCDPTVNLHDRFHVMDGDRLVDIWPIDARGY
ncbi:MAG: DSD1 family PLP-dependent enzyme [Rhodospirillaceae bacterium]|nr:DSD1 family PLP-dependent enzyme [Rhodospirillaceae bacterium]